jgi:methylated-DNA-[protein]-cysteine S-methyltransferase
MIAEAAFDGPLGRLLLTDENGAIARIVWSGAEIPGKGSALLNRACQQLDDYFAGRRREFDLPVAFSPGLLGDVMRAMVAIPYGETRSYGELAQELGASAQAIGQACGANPVPVIVPCHRIVGATGLGGYSGLGGVETKVALLRLEGAASLLI